MLVSEGISKKNCRMRCLFLQSQKYAETAENVLYVTLSYVDKFHWLINKYFVVDSILSCNLDMNLNNRHEKF